MEQRVRNLEDLCELITKEIVEQNKSMIEMNKNLINEIKCLREAYVKQDHDFEDFKNLLQKLYEQNRQSYANIMPPSFPPTMQMPPNQQQQQQQHHLQPPQYSSQPQTISAASSVNNNLNLLNQSGMLSDQVGPNQSMMNNLSFQSERTPFNQNRTLNGTMPSSASALNQNLNKQQQQQPGPPPPPQFGGSFDSQSQLLKLHQQQQLQPPMMGNVAVFNPNHPPPPPSFSTLNTIRPQQQLQQQQQQQQLNSPPKQQINVPLKFAPLQNTTSTPQQLNPSQQLKPQQPPQQQASTTKPPIFQLSPAKPLNDATNKPTTTTTTATPSIFGSNLFKTAPITSVPTAADKQVAPSLMSGSLFKAPQPTTLFASNQEEGEDNDNEHGANPEEYEPQVDFKPIVKLNEVEVKTGEEDEQVLLKQRCKLFRFDNSTKEWKEKGVGDIKLLKHKETGVIRVLMRREHVLKLCANHRITTELKMNEISSKQMSWVAHDFSDNEPKSELFLAKFKSDDEAKKFKTEFEQAVIASKSIKPSAAATTTTTSNVVTSNKPGLNELLKNDNWQCGACYAPNKKDMIKCACCQTAKPGVTQPQTTASKEQTNKPPVFGFGSTAPTTNTVAPQPQTGTNLFSFGSLTKPTEQAASSAPTVKFEFGSKENPPKSTSNNYQPFSPVTSPSKNTTANPTIAKNVSPSKGITNLFGGATTTTGGLFGAQTTGSNSGLFQSFNSLATKTNTSNEKCFGNADSSSGLASASIFKPFGFGGGLQPATAPKPLFGAATTPAGASSTSQTANANNDNDEDGNDNQNPEEYEPQVDFKPLVKLEEVEVKTGEEDEDVLFKARCKLYRFIAETKEWKEKGAGEIKVLKRKETTNVFRILMRRDQIFKLCANHRITSDIKLEIANEKQVRWHAQDYSEPGDGKHELLTVKFRHEDEAKQFKAEVEKAQEILASEPSLPQIDNPKAAATTTAQSSASTSSKPSLSEMFKKDKQWTCNGCYVNNNDNLLKCAACQAMRTDGKVPTGVLPKSESEESGLKSSFGNKSNDMTQSQSANNFGKIQFGTTATTTAAPIIFGSKDTVASSGQTKGLFDFSSKNTGFTAPPTSSTDSKPTTAAPILFGSTNTPKTDTIFGQKSGSSFAELASSSQPLGFGGGFKASPAPNAFMLFGSGQQTSSKTADGEEGEEGDNQNPEEYEPQVDFKPLVKLAEVEVKTGEEDEDVVFKARCKLYRFSIDTKEWKEKGAGEIKILKHKTNSNSYRVLMRRDQIFKICANHRILPEIKLEILNEKQVRWMANDISEGKVNSECLTAKFRHEDEAKQFKAEFEKAQEAVKNQTPGVKQDSVKTTSTMNNLNSLASSLKISSGSWNCDSCLSTNKPESKKCASCDQVRVDKNSTNNDNEFTIEKVIEATPEQKQKAKEFMLPENFYLYLNKPPCKGCIGCAECQDEKD